MKTLYLDIETSPNLAHVWGLFNQNVSLAQLRESTRMICFAAQWRGENRQQFYSEFHHSREDMVAAAHRLLDEADVVVHWNGARFDIPHIQREFIEAGLTPPSPFFQLDLLKTARKQFRFPSNKLDYVAGVLLGENKVKHSGHGLWVRCMAGETKAWNEMRKYNKQDVALLPKLHDRLMPWLTGAPNALLRGEADTGCPRCGSLSYQRRGTAASATRIYQQFRCNDCGGWFRSVRSEDGVAVRSSQ